MAARGTMHQKPPSLLPNQEPDAMPIPEPSPDDATLRRLHAQGLSPATIAQTYHVPQDAILRRLDRLRLPPHRPTRLTPFTVHAQHYHHPYARHLRTLASLKHGERVTAPRAASALAWAHRLMQASLAVTYDPDKGFSTREARPGDLLLTLQPSHHNQATPTDTIQVAFASECTDHTVAQHRAATSNH